MAAEDATVVDLSNKALDKIPEKLLLECADVRVLDLSGNNAIRLDHSLSCFRNVVKLLLSRCALSRIPDEISELTKLKELDLEGSDFSGGLPPAIGQLGRLKKLVIRSCKLTSIPDSIGALEQLEELDLHGSDFSGGLSPAIGQLGRLKKLLISACKLTSIPDSIGALEQLEELDLAWNDFSRGLSPAIGQLGRLKKLVISACKLTSISDSIGALEQLEELDLAGNDFSGCLPPAIGQLGRLKKLVLRSCQLTSIPDSIGALEQLEELDLHGSDFSGGLSPAIGQLGRLKKLVISACKLTSISDSIGALEQLEELDLGRNDFSGGLTPAMGQLGRLKKLVISFCKLTSIPDSIGALEQLEELDLEGNDFSGGLSPAIGQLGRLKKLVISACKLTSISDSIGALEQLEHLDLMNNDFSGGLNPAVGRLRRLTALNLANCKLTALPECIGDLEQVQLLSLGNLSTDKRVPRGMLGAHISNFIFNEIRFMRTFKDEKNPMEIQSRSNDFSGGLNAAIGKLRRLVYLRLDDCKLTRLPESIGDLKQLETLTLRNNRLEEYPRCTLRLKKLHELDVSNGWDITNGNRIRNLPVELAYTNIYRLELQRNPITEPPEEIWSQGTRAIKSFMLAVIPGGQLMHADTLNLIGDTGAGKSSVAESMIAKAPKATAKADRTHVLRQCRMNVEESSGQSVVINDFGGHEIYHCVMPIFLPTNGLLVLVYNMIDEDQEQKVKKWMLTALAKSKQIRMIIIGTHADLIATSEQRSTLEERMATFSKEILRSAAKEVEYHKRRLQCRIEIDHVQNKLSNLDMLHENLASASVRVVTLSCCKTDDGLNRLLEVVAMSLRPPEILPVRWCRAINDIQNPNVDCLYMRMDEVERICGAHFTEADDRNALTTILRYLVKTSQIIWLENHPLLHDYIFHSPQKIIDACKRIIHHDNAVPSSLLHYHTELIEYDKGILLEPLLMELLSVQTENFHLGNEQTASKDRHSESADVVVGFLQQFNLISYVRANNNGKQFIVPCKLTLTEPQEKLQELEKRGNACFNRVSLRLSFIGSLIPMSLFETSLSSMLTVAGELARHLVWPNVWKDGAILSNNGVIFFTKRVDNVIVLTAFSETSESSPWTMLHPILKRLSDNIMASWHGAPPTCAIVCPWCVRYGQRNAQDVEIEIDLPTLVVEEGPNGDKLTCQTCLKALPRSLCFPTRDAGLFITHQQEILQFFSDAGQKRKEPSQEDGPLCKVSRLQDFCSFANHHIEVEQFFGRVENASIGGGSKLVDLLRRKTNVLVNRLTEPTILAIALDLRATTQCGHALISEYEWQRIRSKPTPFEKAVELLTTVCSHGDEAVKQLILSLRSDRIGRGDLAELLEEP